MGELRDIIADHGRTISEVARSLACDPKTIRDHDDEPTAEQRSAVVSVCRGEAVSWPRGVPGRPTLPSTPIARMVAASGLRWGDVAEGLGITLSALRYAARADDPPMRRSVAAFLGRGRDDE